MDKQILFFEVQKQNQKWIWFLLIILCGTILFGAVQQIIFNKPFGTHPIPDWGYIPLTVLLVIFYYLLMGSHLYTEINENRISYQYKPFHRNAKVLTRDQISECYVRLYSPVKEFGGWGMRTAFNGKKGKAYNVSGKVGIQLELKDGRKILIGTNKGKEAEEALKIFQKTN
jgi:hypothetical protein